MNDIHMPPKKTHQHWMQACLAIAETALPKDVPVGALLLDGAGNLVAEACNRREVDSDPTAHAEMLVLKAAGKALGNWRLNDCTLYVSLEPCPMCASAIAQARISTVVFGAYDPVMGACGSKLGLLPDSAKCEVIGGILEEPCGELLRSFFRT